MQTFRICVIGLFVVSTLPAMGQEPDLSKTQQDSVPTFRKGVNAVNVFFTVRNSHGVLQSGLPQADFDVFEDGNPQAIKYFSSETSLPITLGLLIQTNQSMQPFLEQEKLAETAFLQQVVTEKDLGFVISFDYSVDLLEDLSSAPQLLSGGVQRAEVKVPIAKAAAPKGSLLYDAAFLASSEVLRLQVGRKAMVILTDGNDDGSKVGLQGAIEAEQKSDAICYVVLIHNPRNSGNSGLMHQLTDVTGGNVIEVTTPAQMTGAFQEISRELKSEYGLGYVPQNAARDGSFRRVEIKSKNGDTVHARAGYYAPTS